MIINILHIFPIVKRGYWKAFMWENDTTVLYTDDGEKNVVNWLKEGHTLETRTAGDHCSAVLYETAASRL